MSEAPSMYQVYVLPKKGEPLPISELLSYSEAYDLVRHLYKGGCPLLLRVGEVLF